MAQHVKRRRPYDATKRRADALARRTEILDAAADLFERDGFAATTVAAVAGRAGVSAETVYKNFASKAGLVRALLDRALKGEGRVPAYERSDQLRSLADPYEIVAGWSRLATEVSPRGSPVLLLVRDAALVDAGLRPLLADLQELRHQRMTENAEFLRTAGHLREGITREAAADLMWSVTAPEMYELLVLQRGWTLDQYRDYVFHTVAGLLARR